MPKQYCENIIVGSNDQMFMLITLVGTNATAYAITPEHAKHFAKILNDHVQKFAKDVRPIRDIAAGVPSPIQTSDLGSNGTGDSKKK